MYVCMYTYVLIVIYIYTTPPASQKDKHTHVNIAQKLDQFLHPPNLFILAIVK